MKRIYLLKLVILLAILSGWNPDVRAQTVSTFAYTGAVQTYLVPGGVFSLSIDMKGAAGGTSQCSAVPGYGGRVQCTLATTPGQTLYIYVGGQGTNSANTCCSYVHYNGGFNGGGYGVDYGSGGGGATDIRTVLGDLTTRQVVAGGGGAGGYDWCSEKAEMGAGLRVKMVMTFLPQHILLPIRAQEGVRLPVVLELLMALLKMEGLDLVEMVMLRIIIVQAAAAVIMAAAAAIMVAVAADLHIRIRLMHYLLFTLKVIMFQVMVVLRLQQIVPHQL